MSDTTNSDYKVGSDNIRKFGLDIHNPVFLVSSVTIIAFVIISLIFQERAADFFGWLRPTLTSKFDWLFMLAGNVFVLACIVLVVTPFGKIRLGGKDAKPEYNFISWLSMLFAAGMGIGIIFWGVAEPISHYGSAIGGIVSEDGVRTDWSPLLAANDPKQAKDLAMAATIFHWGLHPWAIYAIIGLGLAYFSFNCGLPLTVRSIFFPIFGKAVWGVLGHIIDVLVVFATVFGLATSLGFGARQALGGLNYLFEVPINSFNEVLLIMLITIFTLTSVLLGMDKGVKRLSIANMFLATALLILVLILGPTLAVLTGIVTNLFEYVVELPALSNWVNREDQNFLQGWTAFYWAWWISWSPFVGMFIARISRGRSIREFIICVLLVPTIVSTIWMSVFGGAALEQVISGAGEELTAAALELKMFVMFNAFPLTGLLSFIGVILVIVFFVTSSDSGSLVIDTITAGGKTNAPKRQRIFWVILLGSIAIVLLLGGGISALQAAAIATGFPFAIVMLLMTVAIFMGLIKELKNSEQNQ